MSVWTLAATFYLGTGFLLAVSAHLHGFISREKRLVGASFMIVFWPLLVLVAPDSFFRNQVNTGPAKDPLKHALAKILEQESPLSKEEIARLNRVAEAGSAGVAYFGGSGERVLTSYWESGIPPAVYYALRNARAELQEPEPDEGVRFSLRAPDWYVGFSNEFLKCVAGIDRKLQGRILEAIARISEAPNTPLGDTIKPLSADLSGLWRIRIGNERLVYYPDSESKRITLISFGSRGSVYSTVPNTSNLIMRSS